MKKHIGAKMIAMLAVLFVLFMANAVTSNKALSKSKDAFNELADVYLNIQSEDVNLSEECVYAKLYMNSMLTSAAMGDMAGTMQAMSDEQANIDAIRQTMARMNAYCELTEDQALINAYLEYEAKIAELCDTVEAIITLAQSGQAVGPSAGGAAEAYAEIDALNAKFEAALDSSSHAVVESQLAVIKTSGMNVTVAIILYILGSVAVALVVFKTVSVPARKASSDLSGMITEIDSNQGDLTKRIDVSTEDEVGQLAQGVNSFIDQLQGIMRTIQREANNMSDSVVNINERIHASNDSASDVSATMQELSASMEEVAATLDQISSGVTAVLEEAKMMSEEVRTGAGVVEGIKAHAKEIKEDTIASKESTSGMIGEKRGSLQIAIENSKAVEKINELTSEILSISSQTNLLALNASIEAARAGEAGRGFAVVADEIRVLADNTRVTANNIQEISAAVTDAVNDLAENAGSMLTFIDSQVLADYDKFVGVAAQYNADADSIDEMLQKFNEGAENLAETVDQMSNGIEGINAAVDESAQGVSMAAESTNSLVEELSEISSAAAGNKNISELLSGEVNRFKHI